jgi:hypothetical protein
MRPLNSIVRPQLKIPAVLATVLLVSCSRGPIANATWEHHCESFDNNTRRACYGPVRVESDASVYSYYHLTVEKIGTGLSVPSEQLASEDIPLERVSPVYLTDEDKEVVKFDSSSRTLTFDLGYSRPTYRFRK